MMIRIALFSGLMLVLCFGVGCTGRTVHQLPEIAYSQVVDLTHTLSADMPQSPDTPRTRLIPPDRAEPVDLSLQNSTYLRIPAETNRFHSTEHLSPRELIVPAIVLDMRRYVAADPTYLLTVDQIKAWERQHGQIPAGSLVLLATGWDVYWEHPGEYLDLDANQRPQVPGFSAAAATFLLAERSVAGMGSDTPTINGTVQLNRPTDQVLAAEGMVLENLAGLEQLPATGATLFIGVIKIQSSHGGPATVLAFVP